MQATVLTCGVCDAPLPFESVNGTAPVLCRQCGAHVEAVVFPALFREPETGSSGERVLFDDESSCFYHPKKRAVVPCDLCGRFLCALCDVELNDQHLCPSCIEAGKSKGKMEQLESKRTRYDRLALTLACLPFIPPLTYFMMFTAPAALFLVVRHRKTPLSPVPVLRWRFVMAFILGVLEIALLGLFVTMLVLEATR